MNRKTVRIIFLSSVVFVLLISFAPSAVVGSIGTDVPMQQSEMTAEFTHTPSTPNPDDKITLDASGSSSTSSSITSYEWDGDSDGDYGYSGDPDDGQTSSITFESAGTYTIGLRVTDTNGNTEVTTKQITVDNPSPSAEFTYTPSSPNPDDKITLDASGSSDADGRITSYEWDGDSDGDYGYSGDPDDGQTSSITFESGGTYTVALRVTDNGGKTSIVTKQISVGNPAPSAEFTYTPSSPNPDDKITLDASGSSDADGRITSYEWDGDSDGDYGYSGDPDDGQTSSITFESGGTYTVALRVTDNGGKTSTVSKQISVGNPAPSAEFTYTPSSPNPDDKITLDASGSSDADGRITSYEWDGDSDGDYGYSGDPDDGQASSITFESGGTYTVSLRVTDNGGKTSTVSKQISVGNPAPSANFTYSPSSPNPDDKITLDASGSSDADGRITSYEWDGDSDGDYGYSGDPDDGQASSITFESGGTYTVSLRVTDNAGKEQIVTKQISVENPAPEAKFTYSPSSPSPGDKISLDASGSSDVDGRITSYEWDGRGDGGYGDYDDPSDGQTSSITYESAGVYMISLRVSDNGAKTSTTSKEIQVGEVTTESDQGSEDDQEVSQDLEDDQEVSQDPGDILNAAPTFAEQSSSNVISVSGNTEVLTFAVQNPNVNNKEIVAEIVAEVPNGVSMTTASGSSSGSAALQSTSQTISPGQQDSMRLSISVDDESLEGERMTIPYETRYYPVGDDETIYTDDQQSLEVLIGEETASVDDDVEDTSDSSPGFSPVSALIAIALTVLSAHTYRRS